MDERPLLRNYARIERERRFRLARLPHDIDPEEYERLHDCYVRGTHLRLRKVEEAGGRVRVWKLGQKIPDPSAPDDPRRRQMTTIYLDSTEAAALHVEGLQTIKVSAA